MNIKMKLSILFISLFSLFISFSFAQNVDDQLVDAVNDSSSPDFEVEFQQFDSCEDMESVLWKYIQKLKNDDFWMWYGRGGWGTLDDVDFAVFENKEVEDVATSVTKTNTLKKSESDEFSTTNLQKKWVEEPEIIKTNGNHIYYFNQKEKKIYIINSPLDREVSTIDIDSTDVVTIINVPESLWGINMFVANQKLIIIGHRSIPMYMDSLKADRSFNILPRESRTSVAIYDVSNIAKPDLEKFTDIDGSYTESRMIWNKLYLLTNMYIDRWRLSYTDEIDIKGTDFVPKAIDILGDSANVVTPRCEDVSYIMPSDDILKQWWMTPEFTVISVIDTKNIQKWPKMNVLLGQNWQIHMSKESLYIAQNIRLPNRRRCDFGMMCVMPRFDNWQQTLIHKFKVNSDKIDYKKSNIVQGSLLTQYSMDEDKSGNFKILTSKNWNEGTNFYILDPDLWLEWKIEGIEPGEQFKSSRYIGDKLYLVTFEQTDPLFVIDIADIADPKIIWELKIPWFSTYLHPMWKLKNWIQYLIWLWYDTQENQRWGVQNWWIKIDLYKIDYNKTTNTPNQDCDAHIYSTCPGYCKQKCVSSDCSWEWESMVCTDDCGGAGSCYFNWDTDSEYIDVQQLYTKTFGKRWSSSEVLHNPRIFVMDSNNIVTLPMVLQEEINNGENCTIIKDSSWVEIKSNCYPITQQQTTFAGLKSFKIDKDSWISEFFSVNYMDLYKKLYKSSTPHYNINPRQITNSHMRVWFAGDALYMLNNDFAHFILPSNNNYKYLYFNEDINPYKSRLEDRTHNTNTIESDSKLNIADKEVYKMMWLEDTTEDDELVEAIKLLHKHKVTKFDNQKDFMPTKAIRRDEAAKMFVKFYEELLEEWELVDEATNSCEFFDLSTARPDLPDLIKSSCEYWLFKWYKWKFMPTDKITNWQAVVVLIRLLDWMQDEDSTDHYAQNYMQLAEERDLLDWLNIELEKYRDLPATRKSIAKLLYRAR